MDMKDVKRNILHLELGNGQRGVADVGCGGSWWQTVTLEQHAGTNLRVGQGREHAACVLQYN